MDSGAVVRSFFAVWGAQDIELTLAHTHAAVVYKVHVHSNVLPFGGETRGREAFRSLLFTILADFDFLTYEPTIVRVSGRLVRAHVRFKYLHRQSGETLEGTRRLVFTIRGGLILRIDGYHDGELVDAFVRLTQHRAATNQVVRAPQLPRGRAREGSGAGA